MSGLTSLSSMRHAFGTDCGPDMFRVSQERGIPLARLRYLETEFADLLGATLPGAAPLLGTADTADLLVKLHELRFLRALAPAEVRRVLKNEGAGLHLAQRIAITSGKGGVGKTTVAVNLAIHFAREGRRTLLFDGDLGLANVHVLLGLRPAGTLADVLAGSLALAEAVAPVCDHLDVICGGSGVAALADADSRWLARVGDDLSGLASRYDVVLMDTAAGLSRQVMQCLGMADDIAVIATPNLAAILDAYGMVKSARQAGVRGRLHVLVNRAENAEQADGVYGKIAACARQFLDIAPVYLGFLPDVEMVERSHQARRPLALSHPRSRHARALGGMAEKLLAAAAGKGDEHEIQHPQV